MKTFGQRDEAARKWRESGSENRVVVATMESVYESMDWSLKKTDDNHDITGAEVYFLSWPWGWDDFEQQCGRFIRPGMAKPVNIHVLEGVDTVDQGIADNVKRKQLLQELTLSGVELSPEDQEFFSNAYGGRALIKTEHTSGQLFKRDVLSKLSNTTEEEIIRQLSKIVDGKSGFERFADAFFDEGKDMFRASAFSTEIAKNIILEKGPERILSLGAGTCIFARKVKEDDYPGEVDNLDINPAGLSLAKYNFPEAVGVVLQGGISDLTTVKPVNLDYDQTPFSLESSHYDAVECSFTLNWTNNRQVDESGFPIDAQDIQRVKALSEINRVLKPGGSAVITLPKTALDSSHFEAITKSLEENFGFEIVSNRSGKARATDIGKDVGWIITAVKVDRTDLDNLEPDSLNLLTDSPYVLSHYNDRKNGNVSINMDSQALYSPQDFVVTNPLTNESYDAKNQIQKAYQELPRFEKLSIQEMKYALEKGSIQWRAWHEMRRIIQRSLGYKYHQAERAIGDVIDKEGLATPHLWDNETINHNKALILDEVLNLQPATV
jgi:SAM-dependent methyltransferase